MHNSEKGVRGFKSLPEEERLIKRVSGYLTVKEWELFNAHLKQRNTSAPKVIREFIKTLIH
mgnify:FL=1|jgi:hypothetical protein|tara:strand:+ start:1069 stop:1251 length:183 start_codon:yes stop_codon:yes gene_type:complete